MVSRSIGKIKSLFCNVIFYMNPSEYDNDFLVSARKHSEVSFDALITIIGLKEAEKSHFKKH